jgi:hypothetical protein
MGEISTAFIFETTRFLVMLQRNGCKCSYGKDSLTASIAISMRCVGRLVSSLVTMNLSATSINGSTDGFESFMTSIAQVVMF